MTLSIQDQLKHRAMLLILTVTTLGALIATILHRLEPDPYLLSFIAPPLVTMIALTALIQLYYHPEKLKKITDLILIFLLILFGGFTLFFMQEAITNPNKTLVEIFPAPLISCLFLLPMGLLVFLRPHHLKMVAILSWILTASPIIIYLLLHPVELQTPRGMDFFISLGPAMAIQISLILFYARLQEIVDQLDAERYQYYSQIIERQAIRHQAMEQAFTQIHNGPLQTLALLVRDVQADLLLLPELLQRLQALNQEIRQVGIALTEQGCLENLSVNPDVISLTPITAESVLRLGEGTYINLNAPLHQLLHEVYFHTLRRHLPYFQTLKVKVRNFTPVERVNINLEIKRYFCLGLEEALCNVGKHAQGLTRIVVTSEYSQGYYIISQ